MAEYIEREALIDEFDRLGLGDHSFVERVFSDGVRTIIAGIPAADVAPVVRGRWKLLRKGDWTSVFVCSVCGRRETIAESESYNSQLKMPKKYPYCHCGARMDGDSDAKAD